MNTLIRGSRRYACALGAFLVIEGIWGLFSSVVFGVLTTNKTRATIHLVFGLLAIGAGIRGSERGYLKLLGAVVLSVGVLRFIPGTDDLMIRLLAVNIPAAILNVVVGLTTLAVASTVIKTSRTRRMHHA